VCVVGFASVSLSRTCAFCNAWVAVDEFCAPKRVTLNPPISVAVAIKLIRIFLATI